VTIYLHFDVCDNDNDNLARRLGIVYIYMYIILIFRVDMFIHQRWMESRLEISDDIFEEGDDYVTLLPEFFDNLWQPDPYFLNSKIAGKSKDLKLI